LTAGDAFFFASTTAGFVALGAGLGAFDGVGFLAVMRILEWSRAALRRTRLSNCAPSCGIQGG